MNEIAEGGCDVCIGGDNDNQPEFYREGIVKARKIHRCCECGDQISAGVKYHRFSGKWEGRVDVYTTCLPCSEIRASLCCGGWTFGALWEAAAETFFEDMTTGCLAKLKTAVAKEKLVGRWRKWKGLAA